MKSLSKRFNEKLSPKYFGPYRIAQQINVVAYKLELPEDCRIHPVFHTSQLQKVVGQPDQVLPLPSALSEDFEWLVEPSEEKSREPRGCDMACKATWQSRASPCGAQVVRRWCLGGATRDRATQVHADARVASRGMRGAGR